MFKELRYRSTLIVLILMLIILTLGSVACSSSSKDLPEEPPEITITEGPEPETTIIEDPDSDPDNTETSENPLISENPILVRFIFTDQGQVWENYHVKEKDGKKALYTEDDQEVLPYKFQQFMSHYNMIAAQKDGKWLLYDYTGKRLNEDEWEDIVKTTTPMDNEVNGLVRVQKDGVWGCVDQQGKIVITPNWDGIHLNYYEEVEPFLIVKKDGKYGYLTYEGELVLEAKWDMAVMDVYNSPLDEIFVRLNDEWGTVKVVDDKAGEVDWKQKPPIHTQIGFMDSRYIAQAQTVYDLLYSDRWGTSPSVILFFYDYYRQNYTEILNLSEFTDSDPDWDRSIHYYQLKELRRFELGDNKYKFTAKLIGYRFYEDDFNEASDSLSPNMKALKKKAQEPQFAGRTLEEVLGQVMYGDAKEIFTPSVVQSIEFTMEDPLADIYLKYLSASRVLLDQ